MNRTFKVSLLIVGLFGCGVVVGAFGARLLPSSAARPPGHGAEGFGPNMMRRLADELDLTAAQRAALEPILKRAGDELRVLRRESMRQSGAVIEAMNAAVAAELTPEQRERFAVLKEAQKARMRALMEERQRRRSEGAERESDGGEREGGPRPGGPGGLEGPPRPPREE